MSEDNSSITIRALLLMTLCICLVVAISVLSPSYYEMVSIGIEKTPMFIIGMLIGYYAVNSYKLTLYHLLGGGLLVILTLFAKKADDYFIPYYEMSIRLFLMPLTCIVLDWFKPKRILSILERFGRYSLELYVIHMFLKGVINEIMITSDIPYTYMPIAMTITTILLSVAVCSPIHKGIDFLIKKFR